MAVIVGSKWLRINYLYVSAAASVTMPKMALGFQVGILSGNHGAPAEYCWAPPGGPVQPITGPSLGDDSTRKSLTTSGTMRQNYKKEKTV